MQIYELLFAAPIPVGHRVELIWHREPAEKAFFSSKRSFGPAIPSKPVVRDLDTGIVYGPLDHFMTKTSGYSTDEVRPLSEEVVGGLPVAGALTGRVVTCRVLSQQGYQQGVSVIQTTLGIEPD